MGPNHLSITKRGAGVPRHEARARLGSGAHMGPVCGGAVAPFFWAFCAPNNLIHTTNSPNPVLARVCGRLGTPQMTTIQRMMLDRLFIEFGVDISPAEMLEGSALDQWISNAEDDLFSRLIHDHEGPVNGR